MEETASETGTEVLTFAFCTYLASSFFRNSVVRKQGAVFEKDVARVCLSIIRLLAAHEGNLEQCE